MRNTSLKEKCNIVSNPSDSLTVSNNRNAIYDVIKSLGIIAIVIGHCHPNMDIVRFVYGFHLAVFFFVAGLQFNDTKYAKSPFLLVQSRLKSLWPSYFVYMTFFSLTINIFYKINILTYNVEGAYNVLFKKVIQNVFSSGLKP